VEFYERLLGQMAIGPSIAHQTYGNILSELGWHARALPHRKMAVSLEPAAWSIDGLSISLSGLQFHEAADAASQSVDKMAPQHRQYLINWALHLKTWGHHEDAIARCRRVIALNANDAEAHYEWACNLEALGKREEAQVHYKAAAEL
jgi:tetratricopeptide (TPR) repeat protein